MRLSQARVARPPAWARIARRPNARKHQNCPFNVVYRCEARVIDGTAPSVRAAAALHAGRPRATTVRLRDASGYSDRARAEVTLGRRGARVSKGADDGRSEGRDAEPVQPDGAVGVSRAAGDRSARGAAAGRHRPAGGRPGVGPGDVDQQADQHPAARTAALPHQARGESGAARHLPRHRDDVAHRLRVARDPGPHDVRAERAADGVSLRRPSVLPGEHAPALPAGVTTGARRPAQLPSGVARPRRAEAADGDPRRLQRVRRAAGARRDADEGALPLGVRGGTRAGAGQDVDDAGEHVRPGATRHAGLHLRVGGVAHQGRRPRVRQAGAARPQHVPLGPPGALRGA